MTYTPPKWAFSPHPLIANGHAQTILGIHWPRRPKPYQARQHKIDLDDGDQLVVHEDCPAEATDSRPIVLLVHGLAGCHLSAHIRRVTERLVEHGYRVFRKDMRGCGAGEGLAKFPTHCGRSADIASALHFIAELYPDTTTDLVGFSMGGAQALNLLAEAGEMRVGNLERTLVICPPVDLASVERHFHTFLGTRYDKFFGKLLWKQTLARWKHFPEMAPNAMPLRPRRLREIDEFVIAPSSGFHSADHYYQQASPGPKLETICQPVTILASEDDPVVPVGPLLTFARSSAVQVITTPQGGHLGFLAARNDDEDFHWLDWRILDWLQPELERSGEKTPCATVIQSV